MKDGSLSFWESSDDFSFEKVIEPSFTMNLTYNNIWYINFLGLWATTSKNGRFYLWDLANHKILKQFHYLGENQIREDDTVGGLQSSMNTTNELLDQTHNQTMNRDKPDKTKIDHYLVEVTEIGYLKMLALTSTDNNIRIWDFSNIEKARVILCLNLVKGGVHQIKFFSSYHILLTAGYENSIPIFSLTPKYYDVNIIGRLVGHVSIITAMEVIENSAMVITADDTGCIKTWDIRTRQCQQTISMSNKTIICQLLDLDNLNKVAFIGYRVNFFEYDRYTKENEGAACKDLVPIACDVNIAREELMVCTNKDIRVVDIHTGRLKKIYIDVLSDPSNNDILVFRLLPSKSSFLLADQKGDISLYSSNTATLEKHLNGHSLEVREVLIDAYNNLFISTGGDSNIYIQQANPLPSLPCSQQPCLEEDDLDCLKRMDPLKIISKLKREAKQKKKDATNPRLPVGQSSTQKTQILRKIMNTHSSKEILLSTVSVYHNLIATASSDAFVYLYDYEYGKYLFAIKLDEGVSVTALEIINGVGLLLVATNEGKVYLLEVNPKEDRRAFKKVGIFDATQSYKNKFGRILSFEEKSELKSSTPSIAEIRHPGSKSNVASKMPSKAPSEKSIEEPKPIFVQKILVSLSIKGENRDLEEFQKPHLTETNHVSLNSCELFFGLNNGYILMYSLTNYLKEKKVSRHANTKMNYNPLRTNLEDCSTLTINPQSMKTLGKEDWDKIPSLDGAFSRSFFGHKEGLNSLTLVKLPEEYLLTTGNDHYIKMFDTRGECRGSWNVNHPLPVKWDIKVDPMQDIKNRLLFSLKVVQSIFKRYYNMLYVEGKIFDLKGFIQQYKEMDRESQMSMVFNLTQLPEEETQKKVTVMADEYLPKDFATGNLKEVFKQELIGPSLKQLEAKRRLLLAQNQGAEEEMRSKASLKQFIKEEPKQAPLYFDDMMEEEMKVINKRSERVKRLITDFDSVDRRVFKMDKLEPEEKSKAWKDLIEEKLGSKKQENEKSKKKKTFLSRKGTLSNSFLHSTTKKPVHLKKSMLEPVRQPSLETKETKPGQGNVPKKTHVPKNSTSVFPVSIGKQSTQSAGGFGKSGYMFNKTASTTSTSNLMRGTRGSSFYPRADKIIDYDKKLDQMKELPSLSSFLSSINGNLRESKYGSGRLTQINFSKRNKSLPALNTTSKSQKN